MSNPGVTPLAQAIAHLESLRATLGDAAVDQAVEALRRNAAAPSDRAPDAGSAPRLRQVSVLFVDVAGSTSMLERIGTEDAMQVLGEALEAFAGCVRSQGGEVLKFTGDGLMAAFGIKGTREDDAQRTVQAGLQILGAASGHAERVRRDHGWPEFGVRVGVHTGIVLLGGGPEAEHAAMGHAVHLAARMEQSAPVGQLRISDATWALVRGQFVAEPQPPLLVKGNTEPLRTWLVLKAESGPEVVAQRGLAGVATPMIGRDAELARLRALHARCVARQRGGVAVVLAEAGMGKTRLRREFLGSLGLREGSPGLLQARATPQSGLQPYGLWRQLLMRWLSIPDDLPADQARQRLVGGLAPWLATRSTTRAQVVGQLIGMDFRDSGAVNALQPRELRTQAFEALTEVLHALARAHPPMVLVLDDLHWADPASLDLVRLLVKAADVPMLMVLLARPELEQRDAELIHMSAASGELIRLTPLDRQQGPALAAALMQNLENPPPALLELLVQRAEGNPFYLEELVRMLVDDGVIDAQHRPWTLRHAWQGRLRLPTTLVGVLQARLDALPADELSSLQHASIVGSVFWDAALAALDERSPHQLPTLQARALVHDREGSAFGHTRELAFHHQILRDVTYDTVLGQARRAGHLRIARWLADRVADRDAEFLAITAEHFERAGDSAQALEYYDRASVEATSRFAHEAVLAHIERALRQPALVAPMWRHKLLSVRHTTLEAQGRLAAAAEALADLEAHAEACDSDALRAELMTARMLAADREGQVAEAEAFARRALELAERAQAPSAAALANGELAWLALGRRAYHQAEHYLAEGIEWARRAALLSPREGGYDGYEVQLQLIAIGSLLQRDLPFEVLRRAREVLSSTPAHRLRDRINVLLRQAAACTAIGELREACDIAEEAVRIARAIEMPRMIADGLVALASASGALGQHERQLEAASEAAGLARTVHAHLALALALDQQADAKYQHGQFDEARALWNESLGLYQSQERLAEALGVQARLARLDAAAGQPEALEKARAEVQAVLLQASGTPQSAVPHDEGDPPPAFALADTPTLVACAQVQIGLDPNPAPRAGEIEVEPVLRELERRLRALRAQAPDPAARERIEALPCWRATRSWLDAGR